MWLPTSWSFPAQLASNTPRACTDLNQRPEMPTIPRNANGSSHDEHQPPAAENAWGIAAKTRDARGARRPGRSTKTLFPHHQHLPCVRAGNTHVAGDQNWRFLSKDILASLPPGRPSGGYTCTQVQPSVGSLKAAGYNLKGNNGTLPSWLIRNIPEVQTYVLTALVSSHGQGERRTHWPGRAGGCATDWPGFSMKSSRGPRWRRHLDL
jgi:hypothetical protein